jgi:hypothetical protein
MARNKLEDAQNHLFASLENLEDNLSKEKLEIEMKKAETRINLVKGIVEVNKLYHDGARLVLQSQELYGKGKIDEVAITEDKMFLIG